MPKQGRKQLSRSQWIDAGIELLMENGVQAVAVEPLAKRLGVTKGSFYWHFKNRDHLLEAMLASWENHSTLEVIESVDRAAQTPQERLEMLVRTTLRRTKYDRLEGALRSWATTSDAAKEVLQRVDRRRIRYVVGLLVATGIESKRARWRAGLFYRALIGEFAFRTTGGKPLERGAVDETVRFLLQRE